MDYIIFDTANGEIVYFYKSDLDPQQQIEQQLSPGQDYIEGTVADTRTNYIKQQDGVYVVAQRDPPPSRFCSWVNGQWVEDTQRKYDFYAEFTRERREQLLIDSDWTDTLSAKARLGDDLYNQWQTYRQALRDITKQSGFPLDVIWPVPPA